MNDPRKQQQGRQGQKGADQSDAGCGCGDDITQKTGSTGQQAGRTAGTGADQGSGQTQQPAGRESGQPSQQSPGSSTGPNRPGVSNEDDQGETMSDEDEASTRDRKQDQRAR